MNVSKGTKRIDCTWFALKVSSGIVITMRNAESLITWII